MAMPVQTMVSPHVTALFYHDLWWSLIAVLSTALMVLGGVWALRRLDDAAAVSRPVLTPLAHRTRGYRWLYGGLGAVWMLDGLLQLQPAMPNSAFLEMVITPLLSGQPTWMIHMLAAGIQRWSEAPVMANLAAVWIQGGIGLVLILGRNRRWGRLGLWATLGWGLVVWMWGEGLGGLLTGSASWIAGDPGSVLVYMVSAGLLLLPDRRWRSGQVTRALGWGLAGFWIVGAVLQSRPGSGYWRHLSPIFFQAAENAQPAWISGPIYHLALWTALHGPLANGVATVGLLAVGLAWLWRPYGRGTGILTGVILAAMWWFGQDFGVFGGVGTDPQTAPVLALLMVAGSVGASGGDIAQGARTGPPTSTMGGDTPEADSEAAALGPRS